MTQKMSIYRSCLRILDSQNAMPRWDFAPPKSAQKTQNTSKEVGPDRCTDARTRHLLVRTLLINPRGSRAGITRCFICRSVIGHISQLWKISVNTRLQDGSANMAVANVVPAQEVDLGPSAVASSSAVIGHCHCLSLQ